MSIVGAAFECLNAIIWKWVFIACMGRCSLVLHIFFSKWLRNKKVMDKTLTVCFLSRGMMTQDK